MSQEAVQTDETNIGEMIEQSERIKLSERDTLLVMDLLDNPPEPNEKLKRAAMALPKNRCKKHCKISSNS